MGDLAYLTNDDILSHIANSCESYNDENLFFGPPRVLNNKLVIVVEDESEQRVWQLEINEIA